MIRAIYTGKVLDIKKTNDYIFDIWVSVDLPFTFKAGQFISLFIEDTQARAYSVASTPSLSEKEKKIRLIIGPFPNGRTEKYLNNLKAGDSIKFRGPFGIFTFQNTIPEVLNTNNNNLKDIIFIATSTGIAPFLSMLEYLVDIQYKGKVFLYFGLRHVNEIILTKELEDIKEKLNFDYKYCISQDEFEETNEIKKGYVTPYVLKHESTNSFYLCGSTMVISSIAEVLHDNGFTNLFYENYG